MYSKDFTGTLCGDKIGIKFYSKTKRELVMTKSSGKVVDFDAVTGDYISSKEGLKIIYYKSGLIIGKTFDDIIPVVHIDGKAEISLVDKAEFQDTKDGEISGIAVNKNRFAFAFGNSKEEVLEKCKEGLSVPVEDAEKKKTDYYKNIKFENSEYSKLLAKCVSVMRTQLYSPEGEFDMIWSTPDRLPHKYLWLWDSVFHAIGHRHISIVMSQPQNLINEQVKVAVAAEQHATQLSLIQTAEVKLQTSLKQEIRSLQSRKLLQRMATHLTVGTQTKN